MNCGTSRGNTQKIENGIFWMGIRLKNHHEGDQKLVWVTYEISILGNTQILTGLDPE